MKRRIITGFFMTVVCLPFLIAGKELYHFGICTIALLALKEVWDLKKSHKEYPLLVKLLSLISLISIVLRINIYNCFSVDISVISIIISSMAILIPSIFYGNKYSTKDAVFLLGMVLFLGLGFHSALLIRDSGLNILIFVILISMCNEIFGLLSGLFFGHHKLLESVSPKKTVEGAIGGLIFGTIIPLLFYYLFIGNISIRIVFITLIMGIIGQLGDLFFSKVKRENNIKDFSNLMPGHGGILDRVDCLLFVMMIYVLLMLV